MIGEFGLKRKVLTQLAVDLIIFDFDGVIADSEGLACAVLAAYATELGVPLTKDAALARFTGKRISEVASSIEHAARSKLPGFSEELQRRTLAAFATDLHEIAGVQEFISLHADKRRCIASSSTLTRLNYCLDILKLSDLFGDHVFSSDSVDRGKPYPDIFLLAAERMGVEPTKCVVIEDSSAGVTAARRAGMRVVGLLAASHLTPTHGDRLRTAGASYVAESYNEVSEILATL